MNLHFILTRAHFRDVGIATREAKSFLQNRTDCKGGKPLSGFNTRSGLADVTCLNSPFSLLESQGSFGHLSSSFGDRRQLFLRKLSFCFLLIL